MSAQYIEDDWLPTADNVNALPEGLRRYVHDLATGCDPAGDVAQLILLKDQRDALVAMVQELKEEVRILTEALQRSAD